MKYIDVFESYEKNFLNKIEKITFTNKGYEYAYNLIDKVLNYYFKYNKNGEYFNNKDSSGFYIGDGNINYKKISIYNRIGSDEAIIEGVNIPYRISNLLNNIEDLLDFLKHGVKIAKAVSEHLFRVIEDFNFEHIDTDENEKFGENEELFRHVRNNLIVKKIDDVYYFNNQKIIYLKELIKFLENYE